MVDPSNRDSASTNGTYHHKDLKEALMKAAIEILATQGLDALSLRETARKAGVSHAAPYHHFRDKQALLDAVAERGFRLLRQAMEASADGKAGTDGLQAYGRAYTGFAKSHTALFRLMFTRGSGEKHVPGTKDGIVDDLTLDGICRTVGCGREQARRINLLLWSCVHGLAMLWLDGQIQVDNLEETTQDLTNLLGPVLRS